MMTFTDMTEIQLHRITLHCGHGNPRNLNVICYWNGTC